ncbi:hypothetical protein ACFQVC_18995 [Streptomyces monticola]|uniref:Uncharacterized protein n=1 Tax=Streptomyces monticola TaxID=2666263 RepID=A0ABW2JKL4_9ACTN
MTQAEQALKEKIRSGNLEVVEIYRNQTGPTIEQAWMKMANIDVEPVDTVPLSSSDLAQITQLWLNRAQAGGIIEDDGTFLLTAVTTGSSGVGWVRVRLTPDTDMSRLTDDRGNIEFIARSSDGKSICGVTSEEYDYWVVLISNP